MHDEFPRITRELPLLNLVEQHGGANPVTPNFKWRWESGSEFQAQAFRSQSNVQETEPTLLNKH